MRVVKYLFVIGLLVEPWVLAPCQAAGIDFNSEMLSKIQLYYGNIQRLRKGDRVRVLADDGSVTHDFLLGNFIGQGQMGRVFERERSDGSKTALKIQKGEFINRTYMSLEIEAHRQLNEAGIPHARILSAHPDLFVEKELVEGETLARTCRGWSRLSVDQRALLLRQLVGFSRRIVDSGKRISDLKWSNVMWDKKGQEWKVIDPGAVEPATPQKGTGASSVEYMMRYVEDFDRSIYQAYEVARDHSKWLEDYLRLQRAVLRLKHSPSVEAAEAFHATVVKREDTWPGLYADLVHEGEKTAKKFAPQGSLGVFFECARRFLRLR